MTSAPITLHPLPAAAECAAIWNAACGADLSLTARFMEYNLRPATGAAQMGRVALAGAEPVGFVLASAVPASPTSAGWVDAIAVRPEYQRQGLGSALLAWAEGWLREATCRRARLGGSLHPFVPGLPTSLGHADFFERRGFVFQRHEWDVAHTFAADASAPAADAALETRTAGAADMPALDEFFRREFPGRWHFELQEFLREGGRPADYFLVLRNNAVAGFARLTFEDSERPIERFYMHRLPRPWGQLGPLGVAADSRGQGLGVAVVAGALRHLRQQGIQGCVIDWTDLLSFYAKFGFEPFRQYAIFTKDLAPDASR